MPVARTNVYTRIKNEILGKNYSLSVAYLSEEKIRKINKKYRGKDKATNVLSFAFEKKFGELLLCPSLIKKEAGKLGKTGEVWMRFIVIHAMLHLKGMRHGSRMEKAEKKYAANFQ